MSIDNFNDKYYKEGFVTDLENETFPKGLNEDIIRNISLLKEEPEWLLEYRLKAFKRWEQMSEPDWSELDYEPVDYQELSYYSAPKTRSKDEIPQEMYFLGNRTYDSYESYFGDKLPALNYKYMYMDH